VFFILRKLLAVLKVRRERKRYGGGQ